MPLLAEYVLTPEILTYSFFSGSELADELLCQIKEVITTQAVVRDLRDGEWSSSLNNPDRQLSPRAKELLKKLRKQYRLCKSQPTLPETPNTELGWCSEALLSNCNKALHGVITTQSVAEIHKTNSLVASINKLRAAKWWNPVDSSSVRICRNIGAFKNELGLVLENANLIMFVDGNLDPSCNNYSDFVYLIEMIAKRNFLPKVEIHRQVFSGSSKNRTDRSIVEWEERFRSSLDRVIAGSGLAVEVFVWDRVHDRYLISNLIGISVPYGFDVNHYDPDEITTWTRIAKRDIESIQREYDPASYMHKLNGKFTII